MERGQLQGVRRREEQRGRVRHVQRDPAVLAGEGSGPGPDDLTGRGELVEHRRAVVGHAGGQDQLLQGGGGHGRALELFDRADQAVDAAQSVAASHVLPLGQELGERGGRHRLQLMAQGRQRAATQPAQHGRVAPLLADARRVELALHDTAVRRQAVQGAVRDGRAEAEAGGGHGRGERAVRAREPGQEVAEGVLDRLGEGLRYTDRQGGAERVPQAARVLDRRPVGGAGDADPDGAAGPGELRRPLRFGAALGQLGVREGAEEAEQVRDPFGVLDAAVLGEPLELPLQLGQHVGVEQLTQLRLAQQLGEQPGVQGQGGCAALGERGVALVQELGDVAEEEGAGEGGGLRGGDLDEADLAGLDVAHQLGQSGDVENVLEAFADRLQDDRERTELAGHLQQLGRALALLPQRRALAGVAAGQQERAGGALAEAGGEQGRAAHLVGDDLVDLALVEGDVGGAERGLLGVVFRARLHGLHVEQVQAHQVGVGQTQHDAVIGVHDLGVHAVPLGELGAEGEGPGGVNLGAEGRVDDDPPVAQLVAEAFDDDGAVVRHMAAGLALLGQVGQHVVRGPGVEARGQQPQPGVLLGQGAHLAQERADGTAQFERAAELVALPERQPARHTWSGGDQHPVPRDVLDAPGTGAEGEHVPDPGLVHHLLVQLTDPAAALLGVRAREEDSEQAPIRDRAPGGDGEPLGSRAARDRAGDPVPHHARAQLGEGVGRVAAREHVEDGGERGLGQRSEGGRAADGGEEVVELPGVHRGHGDDLLRQDVQGVARDPHGLDGAAAHPLGDHRRLDQVASVLGEDHTRGDRAHLVSRAAHALQARGDRRGRLHLDDEIHRAHVDAQFQAGGGDHGRQPARLQILLDQGALLLGDRAVMRAGEDRGRSLSRARAAHQLRRGMVLVQRFAGGTLVRDLVEPVAQPLREAAGVGEDDRGAVGLDEVGDPLLHVRPDRRPLRALVGIRDRGAAQLAEILHRHDHRQVELLAGRRLDDLHPAARREIARDLVDGTHGGRQADAAGRPGQQLVEPLQGEGQVGAAFGARDRVHLVQDHGLHARECVARGRRQHQEQRLGGGDQDVRRTGRQGPPLGGRGVPGADADLHLGLGQPQAHRLLTDAGQRTPQVPLDVHREGLQR